MRPGYEISVFLDCVERGSFAAVAETMLVEQPSKALRARKVGMATVRSARLR